MNHVEPLSDTVLLKMANAIIFDIERSQEEQQRIKEKMQTLRRRIEDRILWAETHTQEPNEPN
jgi:hypothetical protein